MCGICGFANASSSSSADTLVHSMAASMLHRGPDEDGFLSNDPRCPGTALGMRSLSIIDLPGGHQPIWNESHNICVVFNGELYNYRELRQRLSLSGHRFSTNSDTEILVHGWEEWGEDLLHELRGMFAFALLDLRNHFATVPLLFLARDPLGIKPLYYAQTSEGFCFASELRAVLASGVVPRNSLWMRSPLIFFLAVSPNPSPSLKPFFLFLLVIGSCFIFPNAVARLAHVPGGILLVLSAALDPKRPRDFATAATKFSSLLDDSVRAHLIADVPVGLFLSSGLDSSAIAALAARAQNGIQSFTLSFPGTPSTKHLSRALSPSAPAPVTLKFLFMARKCPPESTRLSLPLTNLLQTASTPTLFPGLLVKSA